MAQFEIKDGIAIIPEGTTEIGVRAFENSDVRRVVIPDSVEKIDNLAFYRCKSLESVTLPKGLKTIPYSCFDCCESLKEVVIPEGITKIEENAFLGTLANFRGIM